MDSALERRILEFMRNADAGDFARLALELFAEQFERLGAYRSECERLGATPETVTDWRAIPIDPDDDGSERAPAAVPKPASDSGIDRELLAWALPELFRAGPVSLVIAPEARPDGIAETGAGRIFAALGDHLPEGSFVERPGRPDPRGLRSWLGGRQRDRRPVRLVATAAGYRSLLDLLVRRSLKFRLPPGSIAYRLSSIAELAARAPAVSGDDLLTGLLSERLGLPAAACPRVACRRHGTPLLEAAAPGGAFALRHWLRLLGSDRADATILDLASLAAPAHRRAPPSARLDGSGRLTFAAASS